ncbi:hypothetical protein [Mastigocoleus testarum]|uniref:Rho-binding antiterminator n=1 Tax=Mastigocoleus testarum BC008 TaxID=371196 RepID=A0A0V7ZVA9_9CYAN|nr:hypothetical protein [Mastigocoleus testarum]KST64568.1 hypothetical protein BC008_18240 [Mastigocoleus testarum BC008]KST68456.1 hypothetical protein BC008_00875 [Mastigocoleus testarum BC008]
MNKYKLVDCNFHDELEALAILRQLCKIIYQTEDDTILEVDSQIVDVYAANQEEFLKLKDGNEIRLDRLISVNGKSIQFAC